MIVNNRIFLNIMILRMYKEIVEISRVTLIQLLPITDFNSIIYVSYTSIILRNI